MSLKKSHNLFGVLLAGGKGERMGQRPKALLPIGDDTFMSRIIGSIRESGLSDIVVVLGYHENEIRPEVPSGIEIAVNPKPELDMLSSLLVGLGCAEDHHTGALIAMTDYPLVKPDTFRSIIEEHIKHPDCIISPSCEGRAGHPVIFPKTLFGELATAPNDVGARHVVRANPDLRRFVIVDDPGITFDINTPEIYEKYIGPFYGG